MVHPLSSKNYLENKQNQLQVLYTSIEEYIIMGTRLYHLVEVNVYWVRTAILAKNALPLEGR